MDDFGINVQELQSCGNLVATPELQVFILGICSDEWLHLLSDDVDMIGKLFPRDELEKVRVADCPGFLVRIQGNGEEVEGASRHKDGHFATVWLVEGGNAVMLEFHQAKRRWLGSGLWLTLYVPSWRDHSGEQPSKRSMRSPST